MTDAQPVRYEDVSQLRSRISWGAIFGGMVIGLAAYMVLTLLFAAIGLSLSDHAVRTHTYGIAAIIAAVVTVVFAMFFGGWVTTQLTAGETRQEAVIHGILCWAAITGTMLCMAVSGMRAGYSTLVGATMMSNQAAGDAGNPRSWEGAARAAGVPQEKIDQMRASVTANANAVANDPATQEQIRQGLVVTTWATLVGILLSMGAAIGGALAGCGPTFRLFPMAASASRREIIIAR